MASADVMTAPGRALGNHLRDGHRHFQPGADRLPVHRAAEQIALALVAALRTHQIHLLFGLNAFGDHGLVEAGAETGDGADNRAGVALIA